MRRLLLALTLLSQMSCKSSNDDAVVSGGAVARYEVAQTGAIAWSSVPFPNDLFLGADGTIELSTLPRDAHDEPVWQATLALLDKRRGFCATCSVYFPIDGELGDIAKSIEAPTPNDPILFIDLDEKKLIPLRASWNPVDRFVAVRPPPGTVLLRKHRYAVALTTALRARDGQPLRASAGMASARVAAVIQPAVAALGAMGVGRERIASITSYTVDDVPSDIIRARELAYAAEKPVAVLDKTWTTDKLDELLGVPEEKLYGRRKAVDGNFGVLHESVAMVLTGRFRAPRVITGSGTDIGSPLRDDRGALRAGELQDVPFLVTIPKGVELSKAPVVLVHTGLTGTMGNGLILAEMLSRAGAIGVSVEPAVHGARATSARDKRNTLRDVDGPDGLMEHDNTDVGSRFLGFIGFEAGKKAWGGYALGVTTQQAADVFAAMRLVKEGEWSAIRGADPSLTTLAFDKSRIGYFGISNGSIVGTKIALLEPAIAAIVLNVPTGNLAETLFSAPGFRQVAGLSIAPSLSIPIPEDTSSIVFDPLFDIYRWTLEPMDTLALSPYFARSPLVAGPRPDFLVQHAGHDELVVPLLADQFASSIGFPAVGTYTGAPVIAATLPLASNFALGDQKITAGSVRFDGAMHAMVAYAEEESGWATLVPPHQQRPAKVMIKNPVDAVQKQLGAFYLSRFTEGRGRIVGN